MWPLTGPFLSPPTFSSLTPRPSPVPCPIHQLIQPCTLSQPRTQSVPSPPTANFPQFYFTPSPSPVFEPLLTQPCTLHPSPPTSPALHLPCPLHLPPATNFPLTSSRPSHPPHPLYQHCRPRCFSKTPFSLSLKLAFLSITCSPGVAIVKICKLRNAMSALIWHVNVFT